MTPPSQPEALFNLSIYARCMDFIGFLNTAYTALDSNWGAAINTAAASISVDS